MTFGVRVFLKIDKTFGVRGFLKIDTIHGLDIGQERVAETCPFVRTLDETWLG